MHVLRSILPSGPQRVLRSLPICSIVALLQATGLWTIFLLVDVAVHLEEQVQCLIQGLSRKFRHPSSSPATSRSVVSLPSRYDGCNWLSVL